MNLSKRKERNERRIEFLIAVLVMSSSVCAAVVLFCVAVNAHLLPAPVNDLLRGSVTAWVVTAAWHATVFIVGLALVVLILMMIISELL
jgi:hypothetical protein